MTSDLNVIDLVLSLSYRRSMEAKTGITVGRSQVRMVIMLPQNGVGISLETLKHQQRSHFKERFYRTEMSFNRPVVDKREFMQDFSLKFSKIIIVLKYCPFLAQNILMEGFS